jgi:hypothetical protein
LAEQKSRNRIQVRIRTITSQMRNTGSCVTVIVDNIDCYAEVNCAEEPVWPPESETTEDASEASSNASSGSSFGNSSCVDASELPEEIPEVICKLEDILDEITPWYYLFLFVGSAEFSFSSRLHTDRLASVSLVWLSLKKRAFLPVLRIRMRNRMVPH